MKLLKLITSIVLSDRLIRARGLLVTNG